ncbi:MAG TPA: methyltransferase domain-containing protein [Candidatus Elarobacter sp.]|nr:methyltransferase domain-containing protein [Candidatus Elarobacter sp.]
MSGPNDAQYERWQERAPSWLAYEPQAELTIGPFGDAAAARLNLQSGDRVLDIGCGSGGTTLALAERVGPEGVAVGVDIAPAMLEAARERASAAGIGQATFLAADAQVADLGESVCAAAFSRFGVMFFADPVAAFANIRRSLRPGGGLAFACWTEFSANEWMSVPLAAAVGVTGAAVPEPQAGEPGPFAFAAREPLVELLAAGGFHDIDVTRVAQVIAVPADDVDGFVAYVQDSGPVREVVRIADAGATAPIEEAVRDALLARVEHGKLQLAATAFVVSAVA